MKHCKTAALAASIALALGSTAALAAAPAATQLPGQGKIAAGNVVATTNATTSTMSIDVNQTNAVIDWGNGTDINKTGVAGFNIGSGASVDFTSTGGNGAVLNVDVSGNASQIFGKLAGDASITGLYVANANGIIVGSTAQISAAGAVGLIANTLGDTSAFSTAGAITDVGYNGTGGDVTVATGATLKGTTVLISGGGTVNVDLSTLTGGAATLMAGTPNNGGAFATSNPNAMLAVSSALGGATLAGTNSFVSAGDASSSGTLTLGGNAAIAGTFTNTGALTLNGFNIAGALVNNKTVTQTGDAEADGGVTNAGAWAGGGKSLITGGLTNNAQMTNMGHTEMHGGDFVNNGQFTGNNFSGVETYGGGNFTNNGVVTGVNYVDIYEGGNFNNAGSMTLAGNVYVRNGSITNSGKLAVHDTLETASDNTVAGYTKGADYSITNTGTITSALTLHLSASDTLWGDHNGAANNSTGSVTNTGILQVETGNYLVLQAYNDVTLAGSVQSNAAGPTKWAALSATNPLTAIYVYTGDWNGVFNAAGVITIATDIVTEYGGEVYGNQVALMGNLSAVDGAGNPFGGFEIIAGAAQTSGYSVRVAAGKTVTADTIWVNGDTAGDNPNVILQGTLAANDIEFGNNVAVGDVFSGQAGGLQMWANGATDPNLIINSTGRVKTAPYLNDANFRFNFLPVAITDGSTLKLEIDPGNMTGTPTSGLNLLVNSNVNLSSDLTATTANAPSANGTAVTGVNVVPNSHLVLQSTGSITTQGPHNVNGAFYWPGYIYLGNIATDANGNALPGTLGLGTITTTGDFNNVLPGDIAGASGIHFITQFPMTIGGNVITNANAWVNFGTDLLTKAYSGGTLAPGKFFGGAQGPGKVINYGPLPASSFVTQTPNPNR